MFLLLVAVAGASEAPWSQFRGGPQRVGRSPNLTGPRERPAALWTYKLQSASTVSPTSDGERIFAGDRSGLHAVRLDGTHLWSFAVESGGVRDSTPAVCGGQVVFGGLDGRVHAADAATGVVRWAAATGGAVRSSPVVDARCATVYVGTSASALLALDWKTGEVKWTYATGDVVWSSPALSNDGVVYVGSQDNALHAVGAADGKRRWTYATGGAGSPDPRDDPDVISSPAVGTDGTVYVGSNDNGLHAVRKDGARKWLYATGDDVISSPALSGHGTVYALSKDGTLHAVDAKDGTPEWSRALGHAPSYSEPILDAAGVLYVGAGDGSLRAFDVRDGGAPLWTVKTRDDAYDGEPALGFGGRVYAATLHDDDTLTCYGAETAPAAPSTRASKKAPAGWTTGQMFAWFFIGVLAGAGCGMWALVGLANARLRAWTGGASAPARTHPDDVTFVELTGDDAGSGYDAPPDPADGI